MLKLWSNPKHLQDVLRNVQAQLVRAEATGDRSLADTLRQCHVLIYDTLKLDEPITADYCWQRHINHHGWMACLGNNPPRDSADVFVIRVHERPGTKMAHVEHNGRKLVPLGLVQPRREQARELKRQFCERHYLYHVSASDHYDAEDWYSY